MADPYKEDERFIGDEKELEQITEYWKAQTPGTDSPPIGAAAEEEGEPAIDQGDETIEGTATGEEYFPPEEE
jgi:hypothetical protein